MDIRARKLAGCGILVAYLTTYALLAAAIGVSLYPVLPLWAQLIFYAIAGIVWVFPLKPLFAWMRKPDSPQ